MPRRPNFVFILTDDMDAESLQHMPRTRALIGGCGATFNNMFVVNPICTPSNVSILTGQYSRNHQILHNPPPLGGYQKFVNTGGETSNLATWLHDDGYLTGRVGKYLIGYPVGSTHVPPGWDEWHCHYEGFTSYFNYALNENGAVVLYGDEEEDYITDVLARRAEEFVAGAEAFDDVPFFLLLAPNAPHAGEGRSGPPTPAPRYLGSFAGMTAPRPPSFNEADVSDKPPAIRNRPPLTATQVAALDREHQARLESLQAVDATAGPEPAAVSAMASTASPLHPFGATVGATRAGRRGSAGPVPVARGCSASWPAGRSRGRAGRASRAPATSSSLGSVSTLVEGSCRRAAWPPGPCGAAPRPAEQRPEGVSEGMHVACAAPLAALGDARRLQVAAEDADQLVGNDQERNAGQQPCRDRFAPAAGGGLEGGEAVGLSSFTWATVRLASSPRRSPVSMQTGSAPPWGAGRWPSTPARSGGLGARPAQRLRLAVARPVGAGGNPNESREPSR